MNFGDGEDSPHGSIQTQGTEPWRNLELPLFNVEKEDRGGEEAMAAKIVAALRLNIGNNVTRKEDEEVRGIVDKDATTGGITLVKL